MIVVQKPFASEFIEKRSKFISHLIPYEQFKTVQERLREEHPKATHIVYAYRYLNAFHQIVENQSDDNEPKGVAGKPTLKVMQGLELVNSAILTVRYFGGIKLGVGGMIRAYTASAKLVCDSAEFEAYQEMLSYRFEVDFSSFSKIEYLIKQHELKSEYSFLASGVAVELWIAKEHYESIVAQIGEIL